VVVEIHAAGGKFMEQWLPEMGARAINERDQRLAAPAQHVAEARGELHPSRSAADDYDLMRISHGTPGLRPADHYRRRPGPRKIVK